MLPPRLKLEALLPPPEPVFPEVKSGGPRFEDVPINGGTYCEGRKPNEHCLKLQPGFVVDETNYAQAIVDRAAVRRMTVETKVLKELRAQEHESIAQAEKAYQMRILHLEKANADLSQPRLGTQFLFVSTFVLGALVTVGVAFGVSSTSQ